MKNIGEQGVSFSGPDATSKRVEEDYKISTSTGLGNLKPRDESGRVVDLISGRAYPAEIDSQMVLDKSAQDNSDHISTSPYSIKIFSRDRLPDDTGVYARAHRED